MQMNEPKASVFIMTGAASFDCEDDFFFFFFPGGSVWNANTNSKTISN